MHETKTAQMKHYITLYSCANKKVKHMKNTNEKFIYGVKWRETFNR